MEALMYATDSRPVYTVRGTIGSQQDPSLTLLVGVTESYEPVPETLDQAIQDFAANFKTWGGYDTVTVKRINPVTTDITPA